MGELMLEILPGPRGAPLTLRETAVLESMLSGDTTKATATKLGISPKTVETYRARIRAKLNAKNTVELVKAALAAGVE
jgi:two-component system response regulator FixJ